MTYDFVVPNAEERARYGHVVSHGFGFPEADAIPWFERAGFENLRVLREDGKFVSGLIGVPMGQFFGGKSVKMIGVSGVGVAPSERGRGVATKMMLAFEEEAKKNGFALSTLYGATHVLYERAGYFRGALRAKIQVDTRMLQSTRFDQGTTKLEEVCGVPEELRALYTEMSRDRPGFLDRGPYMWKRIAEPRGLMTKTWMARDPAAKGSLTGYVVLATKQLPTLSTDVVVVDMIAKTRHAAHAMLTLLGSYASVAPHVTWQGAPADPFVALLPERHHTIEIEWQTLTQLVDPAGAIAARGFPRHARGEVDLELSRIRLGKTVKSTHRLTIEKSAGALRPTHVTPALALTERGLVALYTGLLSAKQLVAIGDLESRTALANDAIEILNDAFAGPTPALADHF